MSETKKRERTETTVWMIYTVDGDKLGEHILTHDVDMVLESVAEGKKSIKLTVPFKGK